MHELGKIHNMIKEIKIKDKYSRDQQNSDIPTPS